MMDHVNQLQDVEEHDVVDFGCIMYFLGMYRVLSYFYSFVCVLCIFSWSVQGFVKSL